jgi:hypothetical protein
MRADPTAKPLVTQFEEWCSATVSPEGFEIPHALALNAAGEMTVYALALDVQSAYRLMASTWLRGEVVELIFALDRFAKPGQGTTLGDLLAGWHWSKAGRRPFIIEYQHEPRIVKPVEWGNAFWNAALTGELGATFAALGVPERTS